jgi:hypothetical protein
LDLEDFFSIFKLGPQAGRAPAGEGGSARIEARPIDFAQAKSMQDIGRKLLQSVGFKEPDDVSIQAAIALNDKFIDDLQAIHQRAKALTID